MRIVLLMFSLVFALSSCSGQNIRQFKGSEPVFILEKYFQGTTEATGIVVDRWGDLRRQFTVKIEGTWDGEELVLNEDFTYADGEKDNRVWRIRKIDQHRYEGRADDVIGVAKGVRHGNTLQWGYVLDLKLDDDTMRTRFDDWMYLQENGVLINRAVMSKWGIDLAEVILSFRKVDQGDES